MAEAWEKVDYKCFQNIPFRWGKLLEGMVDKVDNAVASVVETQEKISGLQAQESSQGGLQDLLPKTRLIILVLSTYVLCLF